MGRLRFHLGLISLFEVNVERLASLHVLLRVGVDAIQIAGELAVERAMGLELHREVFSWD